VNVKIFISFIPIGFSYHATVPLTQVAEGRSIDETDIEDAVRIYTQSIRAIKKSLSVLQKSRLSNGRIPARLVWDVGNEIINLVRKLDTCGFIVDGLYSHLVRDLEKKYDWIRRVVRFRRHLEHRSCIPKDLNWGKCKDSPMRIAKDLESRRTKTHTHYHAD